MQQNIFDIQRRENENNKESSYGIQGFLCTKSTEQCNVKIEINIGYSLDYNSYNNHLNNGFSEWNAMKVEWYETKKYLINTSLPGIKITDNREDNEDKIYHVIIHTMEISLESITGNIFIGSSENSEDNHKITNEDVIEFKGDNINYYEVTIKHALYLGTDSNEDLWYQFFNCNIKIEKNVQNTIEVFNGLIIQSPTEDINNNDGNCLTDIIEYMEDNFLPYYYVEIDKDTRIYQYLKINDGNGMRTPVDEFPIKFNNLVIKMINNNGNEEYGCTLKVFGNNKGEIVVRYGFVMQKNTKIITGKITF